MSSHQPTPAHVAFMDSLKAALAEHQHLTPPEMLAIASQVVGNLIALQDHRRYSPDRVMEMVARNIEIGNQAAIEGVMRSEGSA